MKKKNTALVLFSGGQDSTICLAWALARFDTVETVGFDYGQRHAVELKARPRILAAIRERFPHWQKKLGADHVLALDVLKAIGGSALTDAVRIEMGANGLPTTFVPGRNLLFLTVGGGARLSAREPRSRGRDVRDGFLRLSRLPRRDDQGDGPGARSRHGHEIPLHTPLMWIDKAATWALAEDLGGKALIDLIIEETVTCYEGDRTHRHAWGYGCGECPACDLRAKGYERYAAR